MMQKTICVFLLLFCLLDLMAQDTLMLRNGKRLPYLKLELHPHAIRVKNMEGEMATFIPEEVLGYYLTLKEQAYFIKIFANGDSTRSFEVLERLSVGKINLYSSISGYQLYMEKNQKIDQVFDLFESKKEKENSFEVYASFVQDDNESTNYIRSPSTKYNYKEILKVVHYYNHRNYDAEKPIRSNVFGQIYIYRTQFQRVKSGIKIKLNGESHDLYMQDFIQLELPVDHASKLTIYTKEIKTDVILSGLIQDQFFEVEFDPTEEKFELLPKNGTELHFEFNNIKDKVEKRVGD